MTDRLPEAPLPSRHDVTRYLMTTARKIQGQIDQMPVGSVGAERLKERRRKLIYAGGELVDMEKENRYEH